MKLTAPLLEDLAGLAALGDAKVDGLQRRVLVIVEEEQVLGLHIPDDDVLLVTLRHDLQHLLDQTGRIFLAVCFAAYAFPQQTPCSSMMPGFVRCFTNLFISDRWKC